MLVPLPDSPARLNGLGSPFGIETIQQATPPPPLYRLNGLGSPFGIETIAVQNERDEKCGWLNGLGSPFGIETLLAQVGEMRILRLNGLGSPFGIETMYPGDVSLGATGAKWPGKPVRD